MSFIRPFLTVLFMLSASWVNAQDSDNNLEPEGAIRLELRGADGEFSDLAPVPIDEDCDADNSSIEFPNALIGRQSYVELRVRNISTNRLVPVDFATSTNEFGISATNAYSPNQPTRAIATYQPFSLQSEESYQDQAELTISYDLPDGTEVRQKLCLRGTALPNPGISVTGAITQADRGNAPVRNTAGSSGGSVFDYGLFNTSVPRTAPTYYFRLFNRGGNGSPLVFTRASLSGAPEFSLSRSIPGTLAPRQSIDFNINFTPGTTRGERRATMRFESNDPDTPVFTFDVVATVTGGTAELTLVANGPTFDGEPISIGDNSTVRIPNRTDFGLIQIGETARFNFRFRNIGGEAISMTSFATLGQSASNPFTVGSGFVPPFSIGPQQNSFTFTTVDFRPTSVGTFSETIIVQSNGPIPFNEYRFNVYGRAVDLNGPPVARLQTIRPNTLTDTPATEFFRASINDTIVSQNYQISNIGGGTLTVNPPVFGGDAASHLSAPSFASPVTLESLETFNFTLQVDPEVNGTQTGSLSMTTNTNQNLNFNLSIRGISRSPDRADIRFPGSVDSFILPVPGIFAGDEPSLRYFSFENQGRAGLVIEDITSSSLSSASKTLPATSEQTNSAGTFLVAKLLLFSIHPLMRSRKLTKASSQFAQTILTNHCLP